MSKNLEAAQPGFLEKTQHFDHERIPERVVHARGFSAKGYFAVTDSLGIWFEQSGSDLRGFAVKFYTPEGN